MFSVSSGRFVSDFRLLEVNPGRNSDGTRQILSVVGCDAKTSIVFVSTTNCLTFVEIQIA